MLKRGWIRNLLQWLASQPLRKTRRRRSPTSVEALECRTLLSAAPFVESINLVGPSTTSNVTNINYTVTFSEPVTGVNPADFKVATTGSVVDTQVQVVPVSGSLYTVSVGGISGTGNLSLNLVDDGTIRDSSGKALTNPNAPPSFMPQQTFAVGGGASQVWVGDLNGDGKPDLVMNGDNFVTTTTKQGGQFSTIDVLLGNGDGTFQPQQTFAVGNNPNSFIVSDLSNNGKLDIVAANAYGNTVSVLMGNGDGTFQPAVNYAAGVGPISIAVADLSGDGVPDLIVADYGSASQTGNSVSVLLGNGNGTFQPRQTFATGNAPYWVTSADVNGDGKPDIVVTNSADNTVGVLINTGNSTFQAQQTFATGVTPNFVTTSDLNGDGSPDLVVTNMNSNSVSVLMGNGNGTFQPQLTYATGPGPTSAAFADVNGDGKSDMVITNSTGYTVSVLPANGDGTFQPQITFAAGFGPRSVAVADLTGNGKPDLILADVHQHPPNVPISSGSILFNNSNGNFSGQVVTIDQATTTTLSSISSPVFGQALSFSANVSGGSVTPTGSVQFAIDGTPFGSPVSVDHHGNATSSTIKTLPLGGHTVTAQYLPTGNFAGSSGNTTFTINPGAPSKLAFDALPSTVAAGSSTGSITVKVEDVYGNLITGDNTTSITLTVNGVVIATTTDINGVATFSGVQFNKSGKETLTVTSIPKLAAATAKITVSPDTPTHLAILSQPAASILAGRTMSSVLVAVEDAFNNIVTTDTNPISLSVAALTGGPTGGFNVLANGPTVSTANGVTTFSNMVFDVTGRYSFTFSDPADLAGTTLTAAVVTTVNPAATTSMVLQQQLPLANTTAGVISPLQFAFYDQYGNLNTNDHSTVTLTVTNGGTFANGLTSEVAHPLNGIAKFVLLFGEAGTYSLTATDAEPSLLNNSGSISLGNILVAPSTPSTLVLNPALPSTLTAGQSTGPIVVQVEDRYGNVVANDTSTLTLYVNGTVAATQVDSTGVVTFNSVQLTKSGNTTIYVTSAPAMIPASATIAVNTGVASQLAFIPEPVSTIIVGNSLPPVRVAVEDAYNNIITNDTSSITLSADNSGWSSNPTVSAVNGVATFKNLSFNSTGSYSLTASDSTDFPTTTFASTPINVTPVVPVQLAIISTLPATLSAGNSTGAIIVQVEDKFGNVDTRDNSTALTLNINGVAVSTMTDSSGVVTFSSVQLDKAGRNTITITSSPALNPASAVILVSPLSADHLAFLSVPNASIVAGKNMDSVRVAVEDVYGNVIAGDVNNITYSFAALTGPGSGPTSGPTVSVANGVMTLTNIVFDVTGRYSMSISDTVDSLSTVTSHVVTAVNPAPATQMVVLQGLPTADATAGVAVTPVQIEFLDQFGNLQTNDHSVVTLSLGTGEHFANGQSTTNAHPLNGIAKFSLVFDQTGTYVLTATDLEGSLTNNTISLGSLQVDAAAASQLVFSPALPSTLASSSNTGPIFVQVEDRFGNLVTTDNSDVIQLSVDGILEQLVTAVNGIASFNGQTLFAPGLFSISASSNSLLKANATIIVTGTP